MAISPGIAPVLAIMLTASACGSASHVPDGGPDSGGAIDASIDAAAPRPDAGADSGPDAGKDAGTEAPDADASLDAGCSAGTCAETVWEPLPDGLDGCNFMVPAEGSPMPPPIVWDPCPDYITGMDCKMMRADWTTGMRRFTHSPATQFALDPASGRPLLAFSRYNVPKPFPGHEFIVAEVDGAVRSAMFLEVIQYYTCVPPYYFSLKDGLFLYNASSYETADFELSAHDFATLIGRVGDRFPRVERRRGDVEPHTQYISIISSRLDVERNVNKVTVVHDRQTGEAFPQPRDPMGIVPREATVYGDAAFYVVASSNQSGIMSWDRSSGTRPLLRWYDDLTRDAANFATDGVNMVWTQGDGRASPGGAFARVSVMTAPFTTDPVEAQSHARRLRSDPGSRLTGGWETFAIDGEYAAHVILPAADLLIVRLIDGYSWLLPSTASFGFEKVIGIHQGELFVVTQFPEYSSIARIRIDSLGEPMPPD